MKTITINGMRVPQFESSLGGRAKEVNEILQDYFKNRVCVNCKFLNVKTNPSNPWCVRFCIGMGFHNINPQTFSCQAFEEKK
jgi:hypothetical protein